MSSVVVYIHGKGGNPAEAEHYKPLFPESQVIGFDYKAQTPWDAQTEFPAFFEGLAKEYDSVVVIANSIGAFFSLVSLGSARIDRAFLISPIVDMEKLIIDMMQWAGVSEQDLSQKGTIETSFGETLSMEYLTWVRRNPVDWNIPTSILYATNDNLQSRDTISKFAEKIGADLTVMEGGEHWFHTSEQMAFMDQWIRTVTTLKKGK